MNNQPGGLGTAPIINPDGSLGGLGKFYAGVTGLAVGQGLDQILLYLLAGLGVTLAPPWPFVTNLGFSVIAIGVGVYKAHPDWAPALVSLFKRDVQKPGAAPARLGTVFAAFGLMSLGITGCTTAETWLATELVGSGTTSDTTIAQAKADLAKAEIAKAVAESAADLYVNLPTCTGANGPICSDPAVLKDLALAVTAVDAADVAAQAAVNAAQPDAADAANLVAAVNAALTSLQTKTPPTTAPPAAGGSS